MTTRNTLHGIIDRLMLPPRPPLRFALCVPLVALLAAGLADCGGGDINFGGGGGGNNPPRVTFTGNLDSISPVTSRDIVVFVYQIDDNSDRCPCPPDPHHSLVGKAAVLTSGQTTFTISGLVPGPFGVVFLLDNAGNAADGEINDGDQIAILDDVDCELEDVPGNRTITLTDVDLVFDTTTNADAVVGDLCKVNNPPVAGRARARLITQTVTPPAK